MLTIQCNKQCSRNLHREVQQLLCPLLSVPGLFHKCLFHLLKKGIRLKKFFFKFQKKKCYSNHTYLVTHCWIYLFSTNFWPLSSLARFNPTSFTKLLFQDCKVIPGSLKFANLFSFSSPSLQQGARFLPTSFQSTGLQTTWYSFRRKLYWGFYQLLFCLCSPDPVCIWVSSCIWVLHSGSDNREGNHVGNCDLPTPLSSQGSLHYSSVSAWPWKLSLALGENKSLIIDSEFICHKQYKN